MHPIQDRAARILPETLFMVQAPTPGPKEIAMHMGRSHSCSSRFLERILLGAPGLMNGICDEGRESLTIPSFPLPQNIAPLARRGCDCLHGHCAGIGADHFEFRGRPYKKSMLEPGAAPQLVIMRRHVFKVAALDRRPGRLRGYLSGHLNNYARKCAVTGPLCLQQPVSSCHLTFDTYPHTHTHTDAFQKYCYLIYNRLGQTRKYEP